MSYGEEAIPFLKSWLAYRAAQQGLSFCATIRSGSKTIFSRAYGFTDQSKTTALTTSHLFQVASQTKMLTAIAVLQLVQRRKLRLDDPASAHLPWLRNHRDRRFRKITLRHLLCHQTGLMRDLPESDYLLFDAAWPSPEDVRRNVLASELGFRPGQYVKYSNTAFALLGQVIQAASGQPYDIYVKKAILEPLGLRDIVPDYDSSLDERIPIGHGLPRKQHRPDFPKRQSTRGMTPAMGAYATTEAMCNLVAALFAGNRELLNDANKHRMQHVQSTVSAGYDQGTSFGFGTELQAVGKRRLAGHGGHMAGHLSATFYDPRAELAVSVAGNNKDTPSVQIVRGIFGAIDHFGQAGKGAKMNKTTPNFNVRLRNQISTIEIVQTGTKIMAIDPDDWEPFAWGENLEIVDDRTLRVADLHNLYNGGEVFKYGFKDEDVQTVRFAGLTLWPDADPPA